VVPPLPAEDIPAEARELKDELAGMLPFAPIASLLIELDARTGFLDCFTHAGGRKLAKSPETKRNILAVLIAMATNLGLARMSEACGVSYEMLAWTAEWYVREDTLRDANTGTSATTPELLHAIVDTFPGTRTTITYGSTEAGLACKLGPEDLFAKPASVGPPGIGVYCGLDDAGELLVRSPYLMSGYFRNPEATEEALAGGWFHTGDLAERDDDGYYSIVGRVKDLIRTGGEYVAPAEVDVVVQAHPAVADGAVAGVPHPDWGEVVTAFVVLRPGQALDAAELRRHCASSLAPYKVPRHLVLLDEIPRTGATMQVQRRRLVELARDRPATSDG